MSDSVSTVWGIKQKQNTSVTDGQRGSSSGGKLKPLFQAPFCSVIILNVIIVSLQCLNSGKTSFGKVIAFLCK